MSALLFSSLFSGLELPGFSFLDACKENNVEGQVAAMVENGKDQRLILQAMHPDADLHGDLRDLMIDSLVPDPTGLCPTASSTSISKSNIIWISSPCEKFSTEGVGEGTDIGSGRLLLTSAKLIVNLQDEQDFVFYEQVSNVLSKKHIEVWTKLVAILKKKSNLWNTKSWQLVTTNVHRSGASE